MNRQIKFRAWDGEKMQELHIMGLYHELDQDPPLYIDRAPVGADDSDYPVLHFSDCPVMQATGLEDKNGNEIYEGDIIRHKNDYYDNTSEIRWDQKNSQFNIDSRYLSEIEVIGNIYENVEALK